MPTRCETENQPRGDEDATLREKLRQARAAWPEIEIASERFLEVLFLSLRERGVDASAESALRGLHLSHLYLACACAQGNPAGIAIFEADFFLEIDRALLRLNLAPSTRDELKQQLRCRLLVGDDGKPPLIAAYRGRGQLQSWLRSVALRAGLHWLRSARKMLPLDDDAAVVGLSATDPELLLMQETYGEAFRTAFAAAMAQLPRRERTVLRQHFVDGLSIDKLAALYRVHRATTARWLTRSQESLLWHTRSALRARLAVGEATLDSIMRLLGSRIHGSVRGLWS